MPLKQLPLVAQGHVLILRSLGEGTYGRVCLGFIPGLGQVAAKYIKVWRPDQDVFVSYYTIMFAWAFLQLGIDCSADNGAYLLFKMQLSC